MHSDGTRLLWNAADSVKNFVDMVDSLVKTRYILFEIINY